MKPPEAYRICFTDGTIDLKEPLAFKIITKSSEKVLNPFTFGSRNQHFNCETLIFENDTKVIVQFIGSLDIKPAEIDLNKPEQVIDMVNKVQKSKGAITVVVEHIKTYPR